MTSNEALTSQVACYDKLDKHEKSLYLQKKWGSRNIQFFWNTLYEQLTDQKMLK